MILFDSTILLSLLYPNAKAPVDPNTGKQLELAKERITGLLDDVSKNRSRVVIPTPVLSEILIKAGPAMTEYLTEINRSHVFLVADFDQRSAIELALLVNKQIQKGNKRHDQNASWAKIKFDQQIVAIAKANRVSRIFSDDGGLAKAAALLGIPVTRTHELTIPEAARQSKLDLQGLEEGS